MIQAIKYKGYNIQPIQDDKGEWRVILLKSEGQPGAGSDYQNTLRSDTEDGVVAAAKALLDSADSSTQS